MADERNGLKRALYAAAGTILAGLVLQSGALLWWAGSIDARVDRIEQDVSEVSQRVHAIEVPR